MKWGSKLCQSVVYATLKVGNFLHFYHHHTSLLPGITPKLLTIPIPKVFTECAICLRAISPSWLNGPPSWGSPSAELLLRGFLLTFLSPERDGMRKTSLSPASLWYERVDILAGGGSRLWRKTSGNLLRKYITLLTIPIMEEVARLGCITSGIYLDSGTQWFTSSMTAIKKQRQAC